MEDLKKQIIYLLNKSADRVYGKGSCGELGDEFQALDADLFDDVADEITEIVKLNFEPKKCMPDNINSKKEYEEYLKAIGHEKYIKDLQHHKDTTVGLWAFDCDPKELLNKFNNSQSDAHSIECSEWEKLLEDWNRYVDNKNVIPSEFFQIE